MLAVSVMILTYVWRVQDLYPALGTLKVPVIASLAAIALWIGDADARRKFDDIKLPLFKVLVGILILMLISVPTSYWPGKSVRFLYQDYLKTFAFMIVCAASIRRFEDVEWYLKVHFMGALMYSLSALAKFQVNSEGRWGGLRYYDANDFALVLVCTIPLAVYFLRGQAKLVWRLVALGSILVFAITLIKTGSRGGFVAFMAAMTYILFTFRALTVKLRMTAVVMAFGGVLVLAGDTYWEYMSTMLNPSEDYNMTSTVGRKAIWTRGFGYMLDRPISGVGVRAFSQAEGRSETSRFLASNDAGFKWSAPHSSFVEIAAELGVTGIVLFVMALYLAIKSLSLVRESPRVPRDPRCDEVALSQAVIGAFIAYCVAGAFLSHAYSAHLYSLFALSLGMTKLYPARELLARGGARRRVGGHPAGRRIPSPAASR